MSWLLTPPGYQQPWYWPSWTEIRVDTTVNSMEIAIIKIKRFLFFKSPYRRLHLASWNCPQGSVKSFIMYQIMFQENDSLRNIYLYDCMYMYDAYYIYICVSLHKLLESPINGFVDHASIERCLHNVPKCCLWLEVFIMSQHEFPVTECITHFKRLKFETNRQ